jgi:hypothetical protein
VSGEHPEWKVGQIAQELGHRWKALTDEERIIFEKKAQEDKERYAEVFFLLYNIGYLSGYLHHFIFLFYFCVV